MNSHVTIFAAAGLVMACAATSSAACVAPLYKSEEERTRVIANAQAAQWRDAENVIIARVVDTRPTHGPIPGLRQTTFVPALLLKGAAPLGEFTVRQTAYTTCGPHPGYHALLGAPDEFYVVLASKPWGEQEPVSMIYQLGFVVDPDILAAWSEAFASTTVP